MHLIHIGVARRCKSYHCYGVTRCTLGVPKAGLRLSRALFRKNVAALPNIRIARPNSHDTHSDSVVIVDILLRTRITYN